MYISMLFQQDFDCSRSLDEETNSIMELAERREKVSTVKSIIGMFYHSRDKELELHMERIYVFIGKD